MLPTTDKETGDTGTNDLLVVRSKGVIAKYEADIYPGIEDVQAMEAIYVAYMKGATLQEAAAQGGIDYRTVQTWARRGGWVMARAAEDQVTVDESNRQLMQQRAQKINAMVEKTIKVNEKIQAGVADTLEQDPNLSPQQLKALSEAHKNASDSNFRAVGIGESGSTSGDVADKEKDSKKKCLVVVFNNGGLPPVNIPGKTITVTEETKEIED